MGPEEQARQILDAKLQAAGWVVQNMADLDLTASLGIAVREFPLRSGHGTADYILYADQQAIGIVEAKPVGHTLTGVELQSARYTEGLPDHLPAHSRPLPFAYESTGRETRFTSNLDPNPASRDVFHFHRPETLLEYAARDASLRTKLTQMPPLITDGLWPPQIDAIRNLERSLSLNRPRALIQMATGSGKTFTAANSVYRLIKHADARRILFLVDRRNLGKQAYNEFDQFTPPDDNRHLTSLYNIHWMRGNSIDRASRVVITTIQRLYSMLAGEEEFDPANEDGSLFDSQQPALAAPARPVDYNPNIPIETFDFIVCDEVHRSVYGLWLQVLEYFDAFWVGLTATPSKQTIGLFHRNLVMEYGHPQAVADGVNVGFDVYRIRTKITDSGSTVESGLTVGKRDKLTRERRYELLDDDMTYTANQLDRDVVAADQIRTVIRTFRDKLPEIFPGRSEVPKTLIFAKDDAHADDIVKVIREEFGKGNDFCQKITYRTGHMRVTDDNGNTRWEKTSNMTPEDVLTAFRNSFNPRIAVTVDMIATGTDVKPLECVFFMRNVKSANFFEQMKGRGVRVVKSDALKAVTPDATTKDHFVIIDAVGVCEQDKTETVPLDRKPTVSFKKVIRSVAMGDTRDDTLSTLAARLARMAQSFTDAQKDELTDLSGLPAEELQQAAGDPLTAVARKLIRAVDPDEQITAARRENDLADDAEPTPEQVEAAAATLKRDAIQPIMKAAFRNRVLEMKTHNEQTIDEVSLDEVLDASYDQAALDKAKGRIETFRQWIEDNRDEITALQLLYSRRYANRLSFDEVKALAEAIQRPPLNESPEGLWNAYETLERHLVRAGGGKQLVDIVSIVRHTIDPDQPLTPFGDVVQQRFNQWIEDQCAAGATFTGEQTAWLSKIAEHIATSVRMEREDFEYGWFAQNGSLGKAYELFGDRLDDVMNELNERLVA
jgi:type I restriction enzyme, R subunit